MTVATFVISNLNTADFTFESITFEKLSFKIPIEAQWHDEHNATFKAVADDKLNVEPLIQNNGLIGVVDDLCLLLSLAQSTIIYCREYCINEATRLRNLIPVNKKVGTKLVKDNKIESYLSTAAQTLRKPKWAERSGFIPAAYYLLIGDSDEIGEVSFMLTWIALETLANAYTEKEGTSTVLHSNTFKKIVKPPIIEVLNQLEKEEHLTPEQKELIINKLPELNRPSIRYKICKLRDAYGWDFITNRLLGEYIKLRDNLMHLGTHGGVELTRVQDLSVKLHLSMYLALIDSIGCSDYVSYLHSVKKQIKGNE